jgi:hypothetical protein
MLWLGSDDASFVTGEILTVDGGQSLAITPFKAYKSDLKLSPENHVFH